MSDGADPGVLAKLAAAAASLFATAFGYHKWMDGKLAKKADKHTVNNELHAVKTEIGVHREHIGKIFDQLRENEQRAEDRHRELVMHLLKGGKQ